MVTGTKQLLGTIIMISIEECKKHIGNNLSEEQIESLREALYVLVENVLDEYILSCDKIQEL